MRSRVPADWMCAVGGGEKAAEAKEDRKQTSCALPRMGTVDVGSQVALGRDMCLNILVLLDFKSLIFGMEENRHLTKLTHLAARSTCFPPHSAVLVKAAARRL